VLGFNFQAVMQLRDALLSYAIHIGHFALNPNSVGSRARSPAIVQLRDALLSYAKFIGHFALNPKSAVGTRAGLQQSCSQLRDTLLSYAKHIGNC
jgi:hypothetical protein